MAYPQVIIPPSVKPVSPLELAPADDQTVSFQPRFARGTTQRQTWGDPIWSAQVRFESLSGADRALLKAAVAGARGGASNILMTPGIPLRGSFPATELLSNNDFRNGTTGWGSSGVSVSVTDGVLRALATGNTPSGSVVGVSSAVSVTGYAPYAVRGYFEDGTLSIASVDARLGDAAYGSANGFSSTAGAATGGALITGAGVTLLSSMYAGFGNFATSGVVAGQYFNLKYASLSRCPLVDAGGNALTYSDQIDNAAWTKTNCSVSANADTAPDGTATADRVIESSASAPHYVQQNYTRTSAAEDVTVYGYFASAVGTRHVLLQCGSDTGFTNGGYAYFTLSGSGTVQSSGIFGTGTNARASIQSKGNGWYFCTLTVRLAASTNASFYAALTNASPTNNYAGDSTSALAMWRCGLALSSFATRGSQTTGSANASGTAQTGTSLYVKGLPVSTNGLLLAGDFVEINGTLMQCTASLNSDANGLGVLQIHRRPLTAVADNTPIIVNNPFGTFRLASDPRITERFGVYTDVDLQLIEATA